MSSDREKMMRAAYAMQEKAMAIVRERGEALSGDAFNAVAASLLMPFLVETGLIHQVDVGVLNE